MSVVPKKAASRKNPEPRTVMSKDAAKKKIRFHIMQGMKVAEDHRLPLSAFLLDPDAPKDAREATDYAINISNCDIEFLHRAIVSLLMQHKTLATRLMKEMLIGATGKDGNLVTETTPDTMPALEMPFSIGDIVLVHPPAEGSEPDSDFLAKFHGQEAVVHSPGATASTVRARSEDGTYVNLAFANHRLEKRERVLEVVHDEPEADDSPTASDQLPDPELS